MLVTSRTASRSPLRFAALSQHLPTWRTSTSSTSRSKKRQDEIVSLRVGGNGHIDLKINRASRTSKAPHILVHLPPGPFTQHATVSSGPSIKWPTSSDLKRAFPQATIIEIAYRLAPRTQHQASSPQRLIKARATAAQEPEPDHRFPTPIHDIFTAWDYITEKELPALPNTKSHLTPTRPKISLLGSHIGGALALSLALTNPNAIHSVAVLDPLVDWTGLDELAALASRPRSTSSESAPAKPHKSKRERERDALARTAERLIKLRTALFRAPAGYFDPFASPLLFLRAPGRDTPLGKTALPLGDGDGDGYVVDGVRMRYGEEEDEVGMVEAGGFGPYDDDWGSVEVRAVREEYYHGRSGGGSKGSVEGSSDGSRMWEDASSKDGVVAGSPRRRKVLQKWPAVGQPEDVLLPLVNITLSEPVPATDVDERGDAETGLAPITRLQGVEMVDLLRRACFWGREKSFAEDRVTLTRVKTDLDRNDEVLNNVVRWLRTSFEEGSHNSTARQKSDVNLIE